MEIEKAFKRLLIKNPFYGLFCLSLPKKVTSAVPTLAIAKQGINCELCINPDFWEQHTDDEQVALLQHELGHIIFQHIFISDSFSDPKLFNICADMEVNSYIDNLPLDACKASSIGLQDGLGTKAYYEHMNKKQQAQAQNPQKPCNGGLGGNGSNSPQNSSQKPEDKNEDKKDEDSNTAPQRDKKEGDSSQDAGGGEGEKEEQSYPDFMADKYKSYDSHKSWKEFNEIPEATKQLMQNNIVSIVKSTAEQVEKQRGTIPGEFRELIDKLREKKPEVFNWKAYFRRLLGSIYDVNIRSTRRKVSKRFADAAGIQHKKKVSILIAIDTSGSVSTKELQDFFSEIEYIYKAGARVTILECDARINKIEEYDGKRIPAIVGRGGTDFNPPVDYYVKHKKEYASLIYFTDGECSLPRKNPSGMVWVITSNGMHQDYPGKAIYIPKEQKQ